MQEPESQPMGMWTGSLAGCTHVCMGMAKGRLCCAHGGSLGSWLGLDKRRNLLDMDDPALCQHHHPRALRVPWVLLQLLNLLCTEMGLNLRSCIHLPPAPPLPGHVSSWCGGGRNGVVDSCFYVQKSIEPRQVPGSCSVGRAVLGMSVCRS